MQNLTFSIFLAFLFTCCASPDRATGRLNAWEEAIADWKNDFAPDRRTDRVEVKLVQRRDSLLLEGYTTSAAAWRRLDSLAATRPGAYNRVRLLGQQDAFGLVRVSVANIRTEPGHSEELTSQALMGTPLELLDHQDGWYLVRTPDRYLAWLETGAIQPTDRATLVDWFSDDLRTCVPAQSTVATAPGAPSIVSELVAGNLLQVTGRTQADAREVRLPDGRTGWVAAADLAPYHALATPQGVRTEAVLTTAFAQVGRPYLWGGTSSKAMDCSGFTKTAYYLNGYVIPRDASQQVHAGTDVPLDDDFSQLQRGDLLFFGTYRADGSERVTHVGFYLGDGRFLHAGADNGYITENSLREGEADYAAHRRNSLLRARRLREGTPGVVPVAEAFRKIYTRSSSR